MTKLSYLLAAAAAIAIASPTFAQDTKGGAGVSINQGSTSGGVTSGGEVKRDAGRLEGRGEMRRGDRAQGGIEVRGERREGMRGEGREMRRGIHVRIGEEGYRERRWHRAHAERLVIVKHRRHRHHMHD